MGMYLFVIARETQKILYFVEKGEYQLNVLANFATATSKIYSISRSGENGDNCQLNIPANFQELFSSLQ